MSTTPGIDYGRTTGTNRNAETGIHFGVISQNTPAPEAVDEIFHGPHSRDLNWEQWQADIRATVHTAIENALGEMLSERQLEQAKEAAADAVMGTCDVGEAYHGETSPRYEHRGYIIEQCLRTDLFVIASPFYTFAQFCSPCVPGAGNLDTPCPDGAKTYCLGHDWFEGDAAPYRVYRVDTGEEVKPAGAAV